MTNVPDLTPLFRQNMTTLKRLAASLGIMYVANYRAADKATLIRAILARQEFIEQSADLQRESNYFREREDRG